MNFKKIPFQLYLIPILAFLGVGVSFYSTYLFYKVRLSEGSYHSFCNWSPSFNCDQIFTSPYAEFWLGFPLSSYGTGWFFTLFFLSLGCIVNEWQKEMIRSVFFLSLLATLFGIYYMGIMAIKLKTYCFFCLIIDGINGLTLALLLSLKPLKHFKKKLDLKLLSVIFIVGFFSMFFSLTYSQGLQNLIYQNENYFMYQTESSEFLANEILETPPIEMPSSEDHPTLGIAHAPIQIAQFSDFQCPYCSLGTSILKTIMDRYPEKIHITFYHLPFYPFAQEVAKAMHCAFLKNQFQYAYEILSNPNHQPLNTLNDIFSTFNAIPKEFLESCIQDAKTHKFILKDMDIAKKLKVHSVPTFFLNGYRIEGVGVPPESWFQIIDQLLK